MSEMHNIGAQAPIPIIMAQHSHGQSHPTYTLVYIRELYYQRGIKLPYFQTPSSRLQTFIIGRRHSQRVRAKGPPLRY